MTEEPEEHGPLKTFFDHLEDLRQVIIKIALAVVVSSLACFCFADWIMDFLKYPLKASGENVDLVFLNPGEAFSLPFTLALYAGLVIAAPIVIYILASYIVPALTTKERGYVMPVFLLGSFFFLAGVASCYFFLLPQTLKVSRDFAKWLGARMDAWTITSYISFVTNFMLGMGIAFEFPLVILILSKIGILTYSMLARSRRYAIVAILIISALVTPSSDALTMSIMAAPLIVMYEACIWAAWFMQKKKAEV
jgi:sec-independent protein translocase protein TatC